MNTPEEEKLVLGLVRVAAKKAGMTPYDWTLSMAVGGKPARKKAEKAQENAPTPEDEKVPDGALLDVLRGLEDSMSVRAGVWAKACDGVITKAGFYARLEKLVAEKKVLVENTRAMGKFYGREMMMNVKFYHLPDVLLSIDPNLYGKLMGLTTDQVKAELENGGAS